MPANSFSRMDSGSGSESDKANESSLGSSPSTSSQSSGSDVEGSDKQQRFVLLSTDGSPSKVVTFNAVQHAIRSVENMSLGHELAVNLEFRLKSFEAQNLSHHQTVWKEESKKWRARHFEIYYVKI